MTLWPGDVIWLGTDNATLPDLKHGDVCEIVQKDIGVLYPGRARRILEFQVFCLDYPRPLGEIALQHLA